MNKKKDKEKKEDETFLADHLSRKEFSAYSWNMGATPFFRHLNLSSAHDFRRYSKPLSSPFFGIFFIGCEFQ